MIQCLPASSPLRRRLATTARVKPIFRLTQPGLDLPNHAQLAESPTAN